MTVYTYGLRAVRETPCPEVSVDLPHEQIMFRAMSSAGSLRIRTAGRHRGIRAVTLSEFRNCAHAAAVHLSVRRQHLQIHAS